jgi:hypothetical protein
MTDNTFDAQSHNQNISLLLEIARDEYKRYLIELPTIQFNALHTYLWISSALFGLQSALIYKLIDPTPVIVLPLCAKFYLAFSILLSFGAFCFGIDSLRGRDLSVLGIESYSELKHQVRDLAKKPRSVKILNLSLITFFENAINVEKKKNSERTRKLHIISALLLGSGVATGLSIISYFIG